MFCTKCGKKMEDDTKFCPYCGNRIADSSGGNVGDAVKNVADTAAVAVGEPTEKIGGETVKDTIKRDVVNTAANEKVKGKNKKGTIQALVVVFLVVTFFMSGFGDSKAEKLAKNFVAATYADCEVKSATKITGNDESHWYVYRVKFDSPKDGELSALVELNTDDSIVYIVKGGVFSKKRYDELEELMETYKIVYDALR